MAGRYGNQPDPNGPQFYDTLSERQIEYIRAISFILAEDTLKALSTGSSDQPGRNQDIDDLCYGIDQRLRAMGFNDNMFPPNGPPLPPSFYGGVGSKYIWELY